jgi:hypothetical protein
MYGKLDLGAFTKAGLYTGLVLYLLCLAFYVVVYGGEGEWMIQPFMPGVTASVGGYLVGLVWSVLYGAGIAWLVAFFYNREARNGETREA